MVDLSKAPFELATAYRPAQPPEAPIIKPLESHDSWHMYACITSLHFTVIFTSFSNTYHNRSYKLGFQFVENVRRQNVFGKSTGRSRYNNIAVYVVFGTFQCDSFCQAHQTHFGSRIIGLTEITFIEKNQTKWGWRQQF